MEWGKQMEKHQENAKLSLYQNTNYSFERNERKTLILDCSTSLDSQTNFTATLYEPLIIDKLSDIYLDSFTTFNALDNKHSGSHHIAFALDINEFNINSNSNTSSIFNNIIIPNEATDDSSVVFHKSKKMNYMCSINPTKLINISGTISNLNNKTTGYAFESSGRFILEMIIVARNDDN